MFMWGRGREGQLGVGGLQDNSVPRIVEELKGRKILKVHSWAGLGCSTPICHVKPLHLNHSSRHLTPDL